jgi:predicted Rossmann fold nucleotide-binding protein DprA/Smf involved in DNA uptake
VSDEVRVIERARLPPLLHAIYDPPPRIYVRGGADEEVLARSAVAVVGARACSAYGAQVARRLGRDLAAAGLVVVSGLARGVDGEAHRGALEAGGVTVAVLGCGIDRDYPAAHADLALEEGRDVLAVPGEITSSLSRGTNALLRLGATPCTSAQDVLELFGIDEQTHAAVPVGETAAAVLAALPAAADDVVRATGLDAQAVAVALAELELAGLACEGDGLYRAAVVGA